MLSSTEMLVEGSDRWITAGNLPRAMGGMGAVSIDNAIVVTGKNLFSVNIVNKVSNKYKI